MSLEEEIDEDIEQAWIEEIRRREKEVDTGKVVTIPADKVLSEARNILKK